MLTLYNGLKWPFGFFFSFFFIILLSMGIFDMHHLNSMQRVSKQPDHVFWQGVDHQNKLEVICPCESSYCYDDIFLIH